MTIDKPDTKRADAKDELLDPYADASSDLSRQAWDDVKSAAKQPTKFQTADGSTVEKDAQGHITSRTDTSGIRYEYSKFDAHGQPTSIKIIDPKTGDYGGWQKEQEGLWRGYNNGKPDREVIWGRWVVDRDGVMHQDGRQAFKDPPVRPLKIVTDAEGHVTRAEQPDGITYEYKKLDQYGQFTEVKTTGPDGKSSTWKKEGDNLWRAYDGKKATRQVLHGSFDVDENGCALANGVNNIEDLPREKKTEAPKPEQWGQLKVSRDDDGELTSVTARDGTVYNKRQDGKWATRMKDGTKGEVFENLSADINGNLAYDYRSTHIVQLADGSVTNEDKLDGSKRVWDKDHHLVEVSTNKGSRHFEYDENGKLKAMTHPDGSKFVNEGQDTWKEFNKAGTETSRVYHGKIEVDQLLGSYSYDDATKKAHVEQYPDGTKSTTLADGRAVMTGPDGRVTQVDYPNGQEDQFKYGPDGKLSEIKSIDTKTHDYGGWKKEADGLWRGYDKDKPGRQVIRGEWTIDENGSPSHTGQQDWMDVPQTTARGRGQALKPASDQTPAGPAAQTSQSDQPSQGQSADQVRQGLTMNDDGSGRFVVGSKDTLYQIATDVLKAQNKNNPDYKPSSKETWAEVYRIAKASGVKNVNVIRDGTALTIPPPEKS